MKILIDECVDWRLLRDLSEYDVKTVRQMGWLESDDGLLLDLAEREFDVVLTTDKNLAFQQKVTRFNVAVVVLCGRTSRLRDLRELVPQLLRELPFVRPGKVHRIP